jgi:CheY-like chemotaxis protein
MAPTAKAPLVLIVDDNDDNRDLYAQYLLHKGYRVATAQDGQSGIEQAEQLLPDVIVMDLSLPVMDGWTATERLKKGRMTRRIPVVALTGHALDASRKRAAAAGADEYLTKPILPENLLAVLVQFLRRSANASL